MINSNANYLVPECNRPKGCWQLDKNRYPLPSLCRNLCRPVGLSWFPSCTSLHVTTFGQQALAGQKRTHRPNHFHREPPSAVQARGWDFGCLLPIGKEMV